MRAPLTPIKAFLRDAATLANSGDTSSVDDPRLPQWLSVAQAAERLAELRPAQRGEYANILRGSVLTLRTERPTQIEGDGRTPADAISKLGERLRLEAEDMERAGCFELALTTVSSVCQMLARGSVTARLLATAHLGRVTRQIGELSSAIDCYTTVSKTGLGISDGPVAAHGFIGLGNVAHARGNRPDQKTYYLRALELAAKGSPVELSAHQGLMVTANQQGELADALLHGWCVHDLALPNSEVQFETLTNLAETALKAGFSEAASSGFDYVIQRTTLSRLRLPAIGGGLQAAALSCNRALADKLEVMGRAEAKGAALPHESAKFFMRAAEARRSLGESASVESLIDAASLLADTFGFHELQFSVESLRNSLRAKQPTHHAITAFVTDASDPVIKVGISRLSSLSCA